MKFQFPTHLRKMWSGTEVQQWLDEQVQPVKQEPVAYWDSHLCNVRWAGRFVNTDLYDGQPLYAAPVSCATSCPDAKAIRAEELERAWQEANRRANASWGLMCDKMVAKARAEALEETKEITKTIGGSFADEFLAAIRGLK